jgi:hypothetical protein
MFACEYAPTSETVFPVGGGKPGKEGGEQRGKDCNGQDQAAADADEWRRGM